MRGDSVSWLHVVELFRLRVCGFLGDFSFFDRVFDFVAVDCAVVSGAPVAPVAVVVAMGMANSIKKLKKKKKQFRRVRILELQLTYEIKEIL